MKFRLALILIIFTFHAAWAQLPFFHYKELSSYHHKHHQRETWLEMGYASYEIKNPLAWLSDSRKKKIKEIDIVFTRYPLHKKDWLTNYDSLLHRRFRALVALIPQALTDTGVVWNLVVQTSAQSDAAARNLPHGVVVRYDLKPTEKMRQSMRNVVDVISGNVGNDSVVISVLLRKKWKNAVIVNDWTGSMYSYGAQAVLWQKLNLKDSVVKYFVFFNDGDHQLDEEKVIGKTGGFYPVAASNLKEVIATMKEVMLNGYGGDIEENDAEAILFAIEKYGKEADHIVLLADNNGGIKDRELIPKIKVPVKVVLCGMGKKDKVHPDYLELALRTGGSIHTLEEDIENLASMKEAQTFSIGDAVYQIVKGKIIQIK